MADKNPYETEPDQTLNDVDTPLDEAGEALGDAAKRAGKEIGKEVVKEGGKAVAKGFMSAAKALGELIVATMPVSGIVIGIILAVLIVFFYVMEFFTPLEQVTDALTPKRKWFWQKDEAEMGGLDATWDGTTAGGDYEDEINAFNGKTGEPLDPDHTALFIQKLKKVFNQGEVEESDNPDEIGTVDESNWSLLMKKEISYFTQENIQDIIQKCADYNNDMFRYFEQFYEYKQWRLKEYYKNGILMGVKWVKTYPTTGTTGDGLFEKLSKIHIEGEKEGEEYKFAVHWQDVMAAAHILSMNKSSDEVDPDDIVREEGTFFSIEDINPETYIKYHELEEVYDLFAYRFDYYYGTTDELLKHDRDEYDIRYEYDRKKDSYNKDGPTLREGDYQLAYRYKRIADPVDDEDDHGADYSSSNDAPSGPAPYTKFVPDRAPNLISNSYDAYKYIYISTDDVPNYTPDPGKYQPPDGMYCIGRWHIQNPKPFIEALDTMNPYWHDLSNKARENLGYSWVEEMMNEYCEYLAVLPWVDEESHAQSRMDFFQRLGQLYKNKTIIVSYEGTRYDGMDEFITELQEQYPGWHIVWEKNYIGEFIGNLEKAMGKTPSDSSDKSADDSGVTVEGDLESLSDEDVRNASEDVLNVAKVIYAEAGTQPYEGKIAVAQVVLNRMKQSGQTATQIVTSPHQFETKYLNRDASSIPGIDELINISYNVLNGNLKLTNFDDVRWFYGAYAGKPETHGGGVYYLTIGGQHFYSENLHADASVSVETEEGYKEMTTPATSSGGGGANVSDSFYPAFADPSTYPFWSYGVTFHPTSHFDDDGYLHLTDQEYDRIDHWAMTYEELRQRSAEEMLPSTLPDGTTVLDPDFLANFYINQGDPQWASIIRGLSNSTIQSAGCLDSTVAMILSWWTGANISVTDVSKYVASNSQLQTSTVLAKYGLKQSGNIASNFTDGVISEINAGRLPIVHIQGKWTSSSGEVLHNWNGTGTGGHFLTIYGYDETGFLVADPGKRANKHIDYEDWGTVNQLYYRSVTKAD